MRLFSVFFFLMPVFLLSACSRTFYMRVNGDVETGVDFCFFENHSDIQPKVHRLREFGVTLFVDGKPEVAWRIEGPFEAACVTYGRESDQYRITQQAEALEPGAEYRAWASDTKSPIGIASLIFKIDGSGRPIVDH